MRVGERGCQLQGSACLLFPISVPRNCRFVRQLLASGIDGSRGVEVMLTEATEDYRKAE